jgi:uncharacterized protein YbaA (DUF1428 family)
MAYVDGVVTPVPTSNLEAYREYSLLFASIFREAGALSVVAQ